MAEGSDELQRGRESYARGEWADAQSDLSRADRSAPLAAPDLELLATAAYMRGDQRKYAGVWRAGGGNGAFYVMYDWAKFAAKKQELNGTQIPCPAVD